MTGTAVLVTMVDMEKRNSKLAKNILATVIYYDGLDFPMTSFETWKYLIRTDYYDNVKEPVETSLREVVAMLGDESLSKFIRQERGFYFLNGRSELVAKRIANGKISDRKIRRLRSVSKWLRFVPFVRMVGVTGGLAMKNAKSGSDWDLLIVLKHGKIWTGRTLVTALVHLLKKRRHDEKISDRICLNYFITEESLEVATKDLFSASEYMFLFPLFGWESFNRFQIRNQWIRDIKPLYSLCSVSPLKTIEDSRVSETIRSWGEILLSPDSLESWLKKIEKRRIMQNPKTHREGSLICADDDALVFLPEPHGPIVFERFKEKVERLNV
jgi:hypothetical protein